MVFGVPRCHSVLCWQQTRLPVRSKDAINRPFGPDKDACFETSPDFWRAAES